MIHRKKTNNKKDEIPIRSPLQIPIYKDGEEPDPSVGRLGYGYNVQKMVVNQIKNTRAKGNGLYLKVNDQNGKKSCGCTITQNTASTLEAASR